MKGRRATWARRIDEACNAETPPERLEELAREFVGYAGDGRFAPPIRYVEAGERVAVGSALASNPSAPPKLLAHLAGQFPSEFCANIVVPLLLLESPDFAGQVAARADARRLLRRPDLPGPLAGALAGYAPAPALREEAAMHVSVAGECSPESWMDDLVRFLRCRRSLMSPEGRKVLRRRIARGEVPAWMADEGDEPVDEEEDAPPARRTGLLTTGWQEEIGAALGEPLLELFARTRPDVTARMAVEFLRRDPSDWWRRLAVALNPDLPCEEPDALAALSEDGNRLVRAAARENQEGKGGLPS